MEKMLRQFSKEKFPEERKKLASEIWEIRKKRKPVFDEDKERKAISEIRKTKIEEAHAESISEFSTRVEKLQEELEELNSSILGSARNYFKTKKIKKDIFFSNKMLELNQQMMSDDLAQVDVGIEGSVREIKKFNDDTRKHERRDELRKTGEMIRNFYKQQETEWEQAGYSKEEIEENFSEEKLASMSMEEYVFLLKRFPSQMVTHVTRQGVRDHWGHMFHKAYMKKFSNGFVDILRDGRLRSPLAVRFLEQEKDTAIAKLLKLDMKNKKEALEDLKWYVECPAFDNGFGKSKYSDTSAIHVAVEEVADTFYGAERGNEMFVAYPAAFVVSNFYHSSMISLDEAGGGGMEHNDAWIWAEEKGFDINAGVVFIPKSAEVDPRSGSRYDINNNGEVNILSENIELLENLIKNREFGEFIKNKENLEKEFGVNLRLSEALKETIKLKFGISNTGIIDIILDEICRGAGGKLHFSQEITPERKDEIDDLLMKKELLYSKPQKTITSEEYWNNYFENNPDLKPSKIVFYEGNSPTKALNEWRAKNGIMPAGRDEDSIQHKIRTEKKPQNLSDFSERNVSQLSKHGFVGADRFYDLAKESIERYYAENQSS